MISQGNCVGDEFQFGESTTTTTTTTTTTSGGYYERLIDHGTAGGEYPLDGSSSPRSPLLLLTDLKHKRAILTVMGTIAMIGTITGIIHHHAMTHTTTKRMEKQHSFHADYTEIQSALELKLGSVDHWCLDGGNDHCATCDDPTHPASRVHSAGWEKVFQRNVALSKNYPNWKLDVVFLGDDNVEARVGTHRGAPATTAASEDGSTRRTSTSTFGETLIRSKIEFEKHFQKNLGGRHDGLALGIAGDTSPNLLWRIRQNEFADLQPKVWWIHIGKNDLFSTNCSEEVTIMGILRVVEQLVSREDGATIVINSLLPVATRKSMILEEDDEEVEEESSESAPMMRPPGKKKRRRKKNIPNMHWYSINKVNQVLQRFAQKHDGVKFFNANDILTTRKNDDNVLYMKKDMFVDKVHLSEKGQFEIAKAQADMLEYILKEKEAATAAASGKDAIMDTSMLSFDDLCGDDYFYDDLYDDLV